MTDLPTPQASRLRRPSWRDSRLLVGVVLVLVSAVLGSVVVAGADERVPMYAARASLVPGEPLTPSSLVRVEVQVGDATADYLPATRDVPDGTFVLREVRPGELVPQTAVGSRDQVRTQPVTLGVDATSASTLRSGAVVEVYVNRPSRDSGGAGTGLQVLEGPERSLERVSVVAVAADTGVLGAGSATRAVQVSVPSDRVQQLVGDVDLGSRITLVPVPAAGRTES
ncbi:MAG TPA: hypothetical protein VES95_10435 [Dermatophilaceae bacterium]|nr:hypothetical protein [Dermatophilaceae bacterium]